MNLNQYKFMSKAMIRAQSISSNNKTKIFLEVMDNKEATMAKWIHYKQ